jgi:hypothetical protein
MREVSDPRDQLYRHLSLVSSARMKKDSRGTYCLVPPSLPPLSRLLGSLPRDMALVAIIHGDSELSLVRAYLLTVQRSTFNVANNIYDRFASSRTFSCTCLPNRFSSPITFSSVLSIWTITPFHVSLDVGDCQAAFASHARWTLQLSRGKPFVGA